MRRGVPVVLPLLAILADPAAVARGPAARFGTIRISPGFPKKGNDFVSYGGGRIISEPGGLDCRYVASIPTSTPPKVSGRCEARFPRGSKVRLIGESDRSSSSVAWDAHRVRGVKWFSGEPLVSGCAEVSPCDVVLDRSRIDLLASFKLRVLTYTIRNVPAGLGHVQQLGAPAGRESIYCGRARRGREEVCLNSDYYGQRVTLNLIPDPPGKGVREVERCVPTATPLPWTSSGTCSSLIDEPGIVITVYWQE